MITQLVAGVSRRAQGSLSGPVLAQIVTRAVDLDIFDALGRFVPVIAATRRPVSVA